MKLKVIDVDGSYLHRKYQSMKQQGKHVAPLGLPSPPYSGWDSVTEANFDSVSSKLPIVSQGMHVLVFSY